VLGGVDHVLDGVDRDRGGAALDVEQPLDAQQPPAMPMDHQAEPDPERAPVERPVVAERERLHGTMPADRPCVLFREPALNLGYLGLRVMRAPAQHEVRVDAAVRGHHHRRVRVDAAQRRAHPRHLRLRDEISLSDKQPVGGGDLLQKLAPRLDAKFGVNRVHGGDDVAQPELPPQHQVGGHGGEKRRRVGEFRRLHDHPAERRQVATLAVRVQAAQGAAQVAAQGAADAAARQQHGRFVEAPDQEVVEPHLAELVDEYGRVGERRAAQDVAQHRRLAAAQEPGEDINRNSRVVTPRRGRHRARQQRAVERVQRPRAEPLRLRPKVAKPGDHLRAPRPPAQHEAGPLPVGERQAVVPQHAVAKLHPAPARLPPQPRHRGRGGLSGAGDAVGPVRLLAENPAQAAHAA
jgi:hypothetical protein